MALPCVFTKQLTEGDVLSVCGHVYHENIRQNYPLSFREAKFIPYDPPAKVRYENGDVSHVNASVLCLECAGKPSSAVELVEMLWTHGHVELAPLALQGGVA
jgi:hypothetical protein